MGMKLHNSLAIECSLDGLPRDWRARVESVVRGASAAYDLYVTTVKAGSRKDPESVLISITREGAETAWSPRVERVLRERIVDELESARAGERGKESARLRFEHLGWDGTGAAQVSSLETLATSTASERIALAEKRVAVLKQLRLVLLEADFEPPTLAFVGVAMKQMEQPERWALWARLLLVVAETEQAIPMPLQKDLMELA